MSDATPLIVGEFRRIFDDRYRIALPPELIEPLVGTEGDAVLAKEREGCLSLWNPDLWKRKFLKGFELIKQQWEYSQESAEKIQRVTRLYSTRSREVKLGQKSRLLVPEGFREFLAVQPNSEVMVVGAGVCLELWSPPAWQAYVRQDIGEFTTLFEDLVRRRPS